MTHQIGYKLTHEMVAKGMKSERTLIAALAEMYVQDVSTRKVKAITEEL